MPVKPQSLSKIDQLDSVDVDDGPLLYLSVSD